MARRDLVTTISSRGLVVAARTATLASPGTGVVELAVREGTSVVAGGRLGELSGDRSTTALSAPIAGIVTSVHVDSGGRVLPAAPLLTIESTSAVVEAPIDANHLYRLEGPPAEISAAIVEGPGPFACRFLVLSRKEVESQGGSRTSPYHLRCEVPEDVRAVPGATVLLRITAAKRTHVLVVPSTAVEGSGGPGSSDRVAVREAGGKAALRSVKIGLRNEFAVEVTEGLAEGDRVVDPVASVLHPAGS